MKEIVPKELIEEALVVADAYERELSAVYLNSLAGLAKAVVVLARAYRSEVALSKKIQDEEDK